MNALRNRTLCDQLYSWAIRRKALISVLTLGLVISFQSESQDFPPLIDLEQIGVQEGFRADGIGRLAQSGNILRKAGDVNGDGIEDFLIGAESSSFQGMRLAGRTFVLFGRTSKFSASFSLGDLNGQDGFRIEGLAEGDRLGASLGSGGDVNGDGLDDIVVGAVFADPDGVESAGSIYVIFGNNKFGPSFELDEIDGVNGFQINGTTETGLVGIAVGIVDFNGDGLGDVLVTSGGFNSDNGLGSIFLIYGTREGFDAVVSLEDLDGLNGFRIASTAPFDLAGTEFGTSGDLNGDGYEDIHFGLSVSSPNGLANAGSAFVIFGRESAIPAAVSLSDITDQGGGIRLDGTVENGRFGFSIGGGGDVNGDAIDDVLIGAPVESSGELATGRSYVVFGKRGEFGPIELDSLDGTNGFRLDGISRQEQSGTSVGLDGDINADGVADLLVNGYGARSAYVIFGSSSAFPQSISFDSLDGENGFRVTGPPGVGFAVAFSDINGDGSSDVFLSSPRASAGDTQNGSTYALFGRRSVSTPNPAPPAMPVPATSLLSLFFLWLLLVFQVRRRLS